MPKPYSVDLRKKVLNYLQYKNNDKKSAGDLFQIGIATIYRWARRMRRKGHVKPIKRRYAFKRIDDEKLKQYIKEHPDYFLREIASHFSVSLQAIFYALRKLKITRKKRLLSIRKEMKRKEKFLCKN